VTNQHDPQHNEQHGHGHGAGHGHGNANDQGIRGALRYLRFAPSMWQSDINASVIDLLGPQRGERLVDIGAGMGAGTMVAARSGAHIVAVEPTPFLRTVLSGRRVLQRARRRIDVADGTAEQLPVDDRSVDAVWAVNTMHHWTDPAQGAAEIARALRPSGRVVLLDEDFQDTAHPDHERFGSNHDDGTHHGFTMVDAAQIGELLTDAGLIDIDATKRSLAGRPSIVITARAASSEP